MTAFATNVNVVVSDGGGDMAAVLESTARQDLEKAGGMNVAVHAPVLVAESEAAHVSGQFGGTDKNYFVHVYQFSHATNQYAVTFLFGEAISQDNAIALAESVLASWAWS
ncbi:hypothetical protein QCD70_17260 [Agreia sp. PsM10]|uniref:hypothetical protein n=1 Tax=Agreia sp. PsM10 TaxID=3030533 RepID=UPI00263A722B|nr:hypothetical protein [Agreia sp. PsM10]MDN4641998.1 hypothetical protein [Agreia sp. PsM10]